MVKLAFPIPSLEKLNDLQPLPFGKKFFYINYKNLIEEVEYVTNAQYRVDLDDESYYMKIINTYINKGEQVKTKILQYRAIPKGKLYGEYFDALAQKLRHQDIIDRVITKFKRLKTTLSSLEAEVAAVMSEDRLTELIQVDLDLLDQRSIEFREAARESPHCYHVPLDVWNKINMRKFHKIGSIQYNGDD